MYFIQVTTQHGQGETYISNPMNLDEEKLKKLQSILEQISQVEYFHMAGIKGELYYFPQDVCKSSVFAIIPIFKENELYDPHS